MPRAGDSRNPPLLNQIGRIVKKRARTDRDQLNIIDFFSQWDSFAKRKTESEAKGRRKKPGSGKVKSSKVARESVRLFLFSSPMLLKKLLWLIVFTPRSLTWVRDSYLWLAAMDLKLWRMRWEKGWWKSKVFPFFFVQSKIINFHSLLSEFSPPLVRLFHRRKMRPANRQTFFFLFVS